MRFTVRVLGAEVLDLDLTIRTPPHDEDEPTEDAPFGFDVQ